MDNIEDVRNSIIISLATCGGIAIDARKGRGIDLMVTFPNTNKHTAEKDVFKTFRITKKLFKELLKDASELHDQISGMIEEEEMKKAEEDIRLEKERKIEEEKRLRIREERRKRKLQEKNNKEKLKD
jgi:hypothetical protein